MPIIEIEDPNLITIDHPTNHASVTVGLKGATITAWKMFSNNLLYTSPLADLSIDNKTPIRGGIPICWPNFGPPPTAYPKLPKHGFARSMIWSYLGSEVDENEDIMGIFQLKSNQDTLDMFPFNFTLTLKILLGMSYLQTTIEITNHDEVEFPSQFLFHTYLHTDNISQTVVTGLKDFSYTDQVFKQESTDRSALLPITEEVDRIYRRHVYDNAACRFRDEELIALGDGGNCDITLRAINLHDVVVWNPHIEKTKELKDLPPDGWKDFVCVEMGTVSDPFKIQGGQTFVGAQRLVLRILSKMSEHIRKTHAKQANELITEENKKRPAMAKILPAKSEEEKKE
jgi:glucose-6-phosphate 1-epimerase